MSPESLLLDDEVQMLADAREARAHDRADAERERELEAGREREDAAEELASADEEVPALEETPSERAYAFVLLEKGGMPEDWNAGEYTVVQAAQLRDGELWRGDTSLTKEMEEAGFSEQHQLLLDSVCAGEVYVHPDHVKELPDGTREVHVFVSVADAEGWVNDFHFYRIENKPEREEIIDQEETSVEMTPEAEEVISGVDISQIENPELIETSAVDSTDTELIQSVFADSFVEMPQGVVRDLDMRPETSIPSSPHEYIVEARHEEVSSGNIEDTFIEKISVDSHIRSENTSHLEKITEPVLQLTEDATEIPAVNLVREGAEIRAEISEAAKVSEIPQERQSREIPAIRIETNTNNAIIQAAEPRVSVSPISISFAPERSRSQEDTLPLSLKVESTTHAAPALESGLEIIPKDTQDVRIEEDVRTGTEIVAAEIRHEAPQAERRVREMRIERFPETESSVPEKEEIEESSESGFLSQQRTEGIEPLSETAPDSVQELAANDNEPDELTSVLQELFAGDPVLGGVEKPQERAEAPERVEGSKTEKIEESVPGGIERLSAFTAVRPIRSAVSSQAADAYQGDQVIDRDGIRMRRARAA